MLKKKITIEDLAVMTQGGFREMDKRFDGVEKRLDMFGEQLASLERRVTAIEDILTEHGKIIRRQAEEFRLIRKGLEEIKKYKKEDQVRLLELERRLRRLEARVFA